MKVIAVIPCCNEGKTIGSVVLLAKQNADKVIVVDNCSTDDTAQIAYMAGADVVYCSEKGMGVATKHGIASARAECVVTLDGDAQHNADEISKLVEPIIQGKVDIVVGSRFLNDHSQMPKYRKFGIKVITWFYNLGHKVKITDGQCCFRAYGSRIFNKISIEEKGFGFSTEVLIKARAYGFRILEVPVSCVYHKDFALNSCMHPVLQGITVILATIKWRIKLELVDCIKRRFHLCR